MPFEEAGTGFCVNKGIPLEFCLCVCFCFVLTMKVTYTSISICFVSLALFLRLPLGKNKTKHLEYQMTLSKKAKSLKRWLMTTVCIQLEKWNSPYFHFLLIFLKTHWMHLLQRKHAVLWPNVHISFQGFTCFISMFHSQKDTMTDYFHLSIHSWSYRQIYIPLSALANEIKMQETASEENVTGNL